MRTKITKRNQIKVNPKPSPSTPSPEEIIVSLKTEIASLKKGISGLQKEKVKAERKIQAQETTILTVRNQKAQAIHRFVVLQAKHDEMKGIEKLKEKTLPDPKVLEALQEFLKHKMDTAHNEPPEK